MSITSARYQELHPEFATLIAHYQALASLLATILQAREEPQADEILPLFLAECARQGITRDAYPFTEGDQGLQALQDYLSTAQTEINMFSLPSAAHEATVARMETDIPDLPTRRVPAFVPVVAQTQETTSENPTEKIPVISSPAATASSAQQRAFTEDNVAPKADEATRAADVAESVTMPMPKTSLEPVGDLHRSAEKTASQEIDGVDVAEHATMAIPVTPSRAAEDLSSDGDEMAGQTANKPAGGADVAEHETVPVLAAKANTAAQETRGAGEEIESGSAKKKPVSFVLPREMRQLFRRRKKTARPPRTRRQRILSWALLLVILTAVLIPAILLVNFGISAYTTYHELSNQAHSAVNHLMDAKNVFSSGRNGHVSGLFDPAKLSQAQQDFAASGRDFQQLQNQLKQSSTLHTITTYFPQYRTTVTSALAGSVIGIDVAAIGQIATSNARTVAPALSGPLLATSGKPLVTQPVLNTIGTTVNQVAPLLDDIEAQSHNVSLDALPLAAAQKTQVGQLLQLLPSAISDLGVVRSLLGDAGWLLGVNQPRTFLIQTMDRAELRGTGGFTGQYGELTVNGGRVAPFTLTDISLLEYTYRSVTQGQLAPSQYRSWWPFANWGLRDSNISADFPTAAQQAIDLYKQETTHQVDGVISFTPIVIEHILSIIGPIQVPGYATTVTSLNLENLLHYYQLDNSGILKQYNVNHSNNTTTSTRKQFTSYLTTLLLSKVRSAPPDELLSIAHQVLNDLKTKELQLYFTDPASENVLMHYGYAGQVDHSINHDGLYVVQENLSASKASQYVSTIMHDTITLDRKGGATHQLMLHLIYNQAGPVYGYDTYYDYLRVYVPPNSQLLAGDGFSSGAALLSGTPLCGGAYGNCPMNGVYPGGELQCPSGQYQPGAAPPSLTGSDGGSWEPLQTIGGPTNTTSDEPGRAMYGGWVIVPKNCTMTVTLSWYVPPFAGQSYSLLVQRQAGTFPELDLSLLPDAATCTRLQTAGMHVDAVLVNDTSFTLPAYRSKKQGGPGCYPASGV